ncbi:DUF4328 domain-containing protein [Streptomyces sp. NPDC048718]|uniref:DUF4328 domain-containing protein n=1 Tax=Streptomyces sp. NPDC048718 TaxID=3365587 RepID=UPI003710D3BE
MLMLRDPNGLARALVFLLAANIAVDLPLAAVDLYTLSLDYTAAGAPDDPFEAAAEIGLMLPVYGLAILLFLATIVVFIVWFHRTRLNAGVWAPDLQSRGAGWAIGGWFVPLVWFWIPRGIAADIWRSSRPEPYAADRSGELTVVNVWWALWVASNLAARLSGRLEEWAETVDEALTATWWSLAGTGLDIAAAVFAILFVRRVTSMQNAKANGMIPAA